MGRPPSLQCRLRAGVLAAHDTLMLQMGPVYRERTRLRALLTPITTDARRQEINDCLAALQAADDAMMDWMHTYHEPDTLQVPQQAQTAFWYQQRARLHDVDSAFFRALNRARAVR